MWLNFVSYNHKHNPPKPKGVAICYDLINCMLEPINNPNVIYCFHGFYIIFLLHINHPFSIASDMSKRIFVNRYMYYVLP